MPAKRKTPASRTKVIEPDEVFTPESEEDQPKIAKRKHIIETVYDEQVEIDPNTGEVVTDGFEPDEPEAEERKAYVKSERERIRDKLKKAGVSSNQPLKLRVDRLPNYKIDGASGMTAEKAFCFAMDCDEGFVTNGDVLLMEIQKRCGPGDYWVTVRYKNSILDTWKETIAAPQQPIPIVDPQNPNAPPTYVYQMPQQNGTMTAEPVKVPTHKEMLKDMVEVIELTDRLRGNKRDDAPQPQPAAAFDVQKFAADVMQSKQVMDVLISGLGGAKSGRKDTLEIILEHGPSLLREAANVGRELIREFRQGQYEQAQNQITGEPHQSLPLDSSGNQQGGGSDTLAGQPQAGANNSQTQTTITQTPEVQIMNYLIDAYLAKVPMKAIMGNLRGMADNSPGLIDLFGGFAETESAELLQWVGLLRPELSEQIKTPEAQAWIQQLQLAINAEWKVDEGEES